MAETHEMMFRLEKTATRGGGDKYTAEGYRDFSIYLPQAISCPEPQKHPIDKFRITIKPE